MNISQLSSTNIEVYQLELSNVDNKDMLLSEYDFSQGYSLKIVEALKNPKDFIFSNYSGIILTEDKKYKDIMLESDGIDTINYVRSSTISFMTSTSKVASLSSDVLNINIIDLDSNILTIKNSVGDYLTYNSLSSNPYFSNKTTNNYDQKFYFTKSNDQFLLYELTSNSNKKVFALNVNGFSAVSLSSELYSRVESDYSLKYTFDAFKKYDIDYFDNSKIVSYTSSLTSNGENLNIYNAKEVSKPYLITFPYYDTYDKGYSLNFLPLKNTKNSSYLYDVKNSYREYTSINNHTQNLNGDSEIILSYNSYDCGNINFPSGDNYFYYYPKAARTSIHNSGLIESGAWPAKHPEYSDRIYKDLKRNYYGLSSVFYNTEKDGTYLYSWLKLEDGIPVWKDRFRSKSVTNSYVLLFNDYDSKLDFEPSVGYSYHRHSKDDNNLLVSLLDSNLIKKVTEYNLFNVPSYGEKNYELDNISNDNILVLSSDTFAKIEKDYTLSGDFSFIFSCYQKNWSETNGTMIFGDYFNDSGWGLFLNDQITPNYLLSYDSQINNYNKELQNVKTLNYSNSNNIITISRTENECFWVVSNSDAYLYDLDGDIIDFIDLSTHGVVLDFKTNSEGNAYIKYSNGNIYFLNKITKTLTLYLSGVMGAISVDINDELLYDGSSTVTKYDVDENNISYRIDSGILVFDGINLLSSTQIEDFCFDGDNIMWVCDGSNLKILDSNRLLVDSIESSTTIGDDILGRRISILKREDVYYCLLRTVHISRNKSYLEIFNIVNNKIVRIKGIRDSNKNATLTYNFSGYEYVLKYSKNEKLKLKINFSYKNDLGGISSLKIQEHIPVALEKGYHQFCLTYNYRLGLLQLYIDTVSIYQKYISPNVYVLSNIYQTPIFIGTFPSKSESLSESVEEKKSFCMTGKIKDVRIYSKDLTEIEQRAILLRNYNIPTLTWNVPSQKRIFIERIERIFQNRVPGNKSNIFNLIIKDSQLNNNNQTDAESKLTEKIKKIIPVNSALNKIEWK